MNLSSHPDEKAPPNTLRPSPPWSRRSAFINSKECPPLPVEIAVVKKSTSFFFRKHKTPEEEKAKLASSCPGVASAALGCSGRSIASSITFTERDDVDEDHLDDPKHDEGTEHLDLKPFIPRRQESVPRLSCALDEVATGNANTSAAQHPHSVSQTATDSPPIKPKRSFSFASSLDKLDTDASRSLELPRYRSGELKSEGTTKAPQYRSLPTLSLCKPRHFKKTGVEADVTRLAPKAALFYAIMTAEVKNHKHGIITYKMCFLGSEAVDKMIQNDLAKTRDEAVILGRDLMKTFSLFRSVSLSQNFKDKAHAYYRFWDGG